MLQSFAQTILSCYSQAAAGTSTKILETRKTVPGLRLLDKWAVLIGGGSNHRMGLYDMMMIKDNHVMAAGGISAAIKGAEAYIKWVYAGVLTITDANS